MINREHSIARTLAPIALVAAFLAVIVVIASTPGSGGGGSKTSSGQSAQQTRTGKVRKRYIVKTGDSLSVIADKTGVPVEKLTALNPQIDPQALISGSCIALRSTSDCK